MYKEYLILKFIQQNISTGFLTKIMTICTKLANKGAIFFALSFIMMIFPKYRRLGILCLMAVGANAFFCNIIIKPLAARARPFTTYPDLICKLSKIPKDYSFPSGHTSASFAFCTCLFYYHRDIALPALIFALLVAFSRMYLMVHYPTDVLFGAILGTTVSTVMYLMPITQKVADYILLKL